MYDTKEKIKEFCITNQFKEQDVNRFVRYITPNGVIEIVLKEGGVYIKYRVAFVSNSDDYKEYTINKLIYFNQLKIYEIEDINAILKNEILDIIKETYSDILFNNK